MASATLAADSNSKSHRCHLMYWSIFSTSNFKQTPKPRHVLWVWDELVQTWKTWRRLATVKATTRGLRRWWTAPMCGWGSRRTWASSTCSRWWCKRWDKVSPVHDSDKKRREIARRCTVFRNIVTHEKPQTLPSCKFTNTHLQLYTLSSFASC